MESDFSKLQAQPVRISQPLWLIKRTKKTRTTNRAWRITFDLVGFVPITTRYRLMTLPIRFALLILSLFATLLAGLWLHERLDATETSQLRQTLQRDREALVNRLVELTGDPLRVFVTDYSPWDELVSFVAHPDPEWARVNIDSALDTHHVDATWILRPDFSEVYGSVRDDQSSLRPFPLPKEILRQLTTTSRDSHFFVQTDAGLLELHGAPIRPSDVHAVIPAPYGWLFAAHRWDDTYLRQLETLLDGTIDLATGPARIAPPVTVVTANPLRDWQGHTLSELRTSVVAPALLRATASTRSDLLVLGGFGIIALLAYSVATHVWVVRPLRRLGSSLKHRSDRPLAALLRQGGEFGNLGRLVQESFRQEDKLRQIYTAFNAIDDAVLITDSSDGRIIHVNLGATRLLGHDAADLQGRTLADLKAAPPSASSEGLWFRCRDGRLVEVEAKEQALPGNAAQRMTVTVARDISDRRQLEQKRLRAQRLESLGTLAGGVAHDMNNMLTPIVLMLDELENFHQEPNAALLGSVRSSVKRGATILRQLLTFGHGFEGDRVPLKFGHLVEELGRIVASTFPKSVTFETDISHQLPAVIGDPTQIHQVLLNLCVNARDALPKGGTISVSVAPQLIDAANIADWTDAKPGFYVRLEVTDNGDGIPPEIIDRIFDPFFTTKTADKGTGLGLSTTLGIIRTHGGSIRVKSEPGHGTCFSILLPAVEGAKADSNAPVTLGTRPAIFHGDGRTVLVIEDEESIRNVLIRMLGRMSFKVIAAEAGQKGLDLFQQHRADISLVITDLNMPGLDGLTVLRSLRAAAPALCIVVMSGRIDEPVRASLKQLGISGLIDKPFGYTQILEAVRTALG